MATICQLHFFLDKNIVCGIFHIRKSNHAINPDEAILILTDKEGGP